MRVDLTFRMTASTVGVEFSGADLVEDCFRNDRTRGIAGAEKQDVVGMIGHMGAPSVAASRRILGRRLRHTAGALPLMRDAGRVLSGAVAIDRALACGVKSFPGDACRIARP